MDAGGQLLFQGLVDEALTGDAAEPAKCRRGDRHREMGFPLGTGAGMAGMPMRLVDDVQSRRRKPLRQLIANRLGNTHRVSLRSPLCNSTAAARKPARLSPIYWMNPLSASLFAQSRSLRI